jgi:hypothetical protein
MRGKEFKGKILKVEFGNGGRDSQKKSRYK